MNLVERFKLGKLVRSLRSTGFTVVKYNVQEVLCTKTGYKICTLYPSSKEVVFTQNIQSRSSVYIPSIFLDVNDNLTPPKGWTLRL